MILLSLSLFMLESSILGQKTCPKLDASNNPILNFHKTQPESSIELIRSFAALKMKSDTPVIQPTMSLKEAVPCNEKSMEPRRAQRGDYWVLYNYVPMSMGVRCWESVTYTTHADYTFLDNLEPLLERWRAPISIAMHAPGTDFAATLDAIKYSRNCGSPLVSQLVTFHVFFSSKHVPKVVGKEGNRDIYILSLSLFFFLSSWSIRSFFLFLSFGCIFELIKKRRGCRFVEMGI